MKLRVYVSLCLALLGWPSRALAQQQHTSANTVSGTPWVDNRGIGEGIGIRTGNVEWHPGVSGEVGYDSNYYQRASSDIEEENFGPPVNSLRFRVTPQLSLKTYDRSAETDDARPQQAFRFDALAYASYNEFIPLKKGYAEEFSKLRNVQGGVSAGLDILPQRPWSGRLQGGYTYLAEPTNTGGFNAQFDRHVVSTGASLDWAPGGGAFAWTLVEYNGSLTFFQDADVFHVYDRQIHGLSSHGSWRFLPKTSLFYRTQLDIIRYPEGGQNDGEALEAQMGVNGLLTKRLALMLSAGWATSFYRDQIGLVRNYNGPVGQAEIKWYFSAESKLKAGDSNVGASALALGFIRDYSPSYLGDYYRMHRGYIQGSYMMGGRVVTTLSGGVSRIDYPDFMSNGGAQDAFSETRLDVNSFTEYRPSQSVGINLQLRYDQNFSKVVDFEDFSDDFSFNRFRATLGARWFM